MSKINYLGWTYKSFNIKDEDYVWYTTKHRNISDAVHSFQNINGKCLNKMYIFRTEKPKCLK